MRPTSVQCTNALLRDLAESFLVQKDEVVDCADLAPNLFKRTLLDVPNLSFIETVVVSPGKERGGDWGSGSMNKGAKIGLLDAHTEEGK